MTTRRGGRSSQVRPRPPSTGRPRQLKVRPLAPAAGRLSPHKAPVRSGGLPLLPRLMLIASIVLLGGAVVLGATGGLGRLVGGFGTIVGDAIGRITETPTPSPTATAKIATPILVAPTEPYTNQAAVDLTGSVPPEIVGNRTAKLRLYLTLNGQVPAPIKEIAAPPTTSFTFPDIDLTKGENSFAVTIVIGDIESDFSPAVTYVLDQAAPKVTITSPKADAVVNAATVSIQGKTQGRSAVVARNEANGTTRTAEADASGTFQITMTLASGINGITVTATDPAGNASKAVVLSVRRGSGKLTATIRASDYQFSAKRLPAELTLTSVVTDPDGNPLENATVTFTVSIPGLTTISTDVMADATGTATFRTTIPKGATAGQSGPATVLVNTTEFGRASARTVITIVK